MGEFNGRIALVTGAASGIGRSVALELARRGASVIVADIGTGENTVTEITAEGGTAIFQPLDVQDTRAVAAAIAKIVERYGQLDIAVNNAGIDPEVTSEPAWDDAAFDRIMGVNVKGMYNCLKHEILQMRHQEKGAIVNVASAAGLVGVANKPGYTASKHAVVGLTRATALQYAREGISINAVCPGAVDTPMLDANLSDPSQKSLVAANHPIGRLATSEDITAAILWLCSDASAYVTGQALAVDGGLTVQ